MPKYAKFRVEFPNWGRDHIIELIRYIVRSMAPAVSWYSQVPNRWTSELLRNVFSNTAASADEVKFKSGLIWR